MTRHRLPHEMSNPTLCLHQGADKTSGGEMRKYNESVVSLNVYSDEECGTDIIVRVALDTEQAIEFARALDDALGFCEQRDFRVNGRMLAQYLLERNQEVALWK